MSINKSHKVQTGRNSLRHADRTQIHNPTQHLACHLPLGGRLWVKCQRLVIETSILPCTKASLIEGGGTLNMLENSKIFNF